MSQHDELRDELEDRLTDQALVEVVGGRHPPDLTARVLAAAQPAKVRRSRRRQFALAASMLLAAGLAAGFAVFRTHRAATEMHVAEKSPSQQDTSQASTEIERNAVAKHTDADGTVPPSDDSQKAVHEQLASLVDKFNELMDQKRFAEAEVVYERAAQLAPDELVVQQLKNVVKMVSRTQKYRQPAYEEGSFTALNNAETSAVPVDNGRPYQFENGRNVQRLATRVYPVADLVAVPKGDRPIFYPDPETWRLLTERRKKSKAVDLTEQGPTEAKILAALDEKTDLDFTDQSLMDVIDYLKNRHDIEIQLDARALTDAGLGTDPPITRRIKGITLRSALKLVLSEFDLTYVIRNDVLMITSKTVAEELLAMRLYDDDRDRYARIIENPFLGVTENPLSTFGVDVDTASYAKVRRYLLQEGELPPPDAVRIEELVNYFAYDYAPPEADVPFATHVEVAACPWQPEHRLLRIGIKGREVPADEHPAANLVFLIDVSGSMEPDDRLPRVRRAMRLLVDQLRENDRVAIVVYAADSGLVLPSTTGFQKDRIAVALEGLHAGGSTNGGAGIRLAYDTAQEHFIQGGTNRVILCTDGDFNVGTTSTGDLERLVEVRAKSGVFLTVLGFGMGNHNDELMEKLADKGNGNYGYVDSEEEARKLLVEQAGGTLVTIAKDVKVQLEFNPRLVAAYRLIGYEDRLLQPEDFNNDKKDAGDIGAGHTVTALYELIPAGKPASVLEVDELKYQRPAELTPAASSDEVLTLKLKYKKPDGEPSGEPLSLPVKDSGNRFGEASVDFRFAAAVASFGLMLRDSQFKANLTYDAAVELAQSAIGPDRDGRRAEFLEMVRKAKRLARQARATEK